MTTKQIQKHTEVIREVLKGSSTKSIVRLGLADKKTIINIKRNIGLYKEYTSLRDGNVYFCKILTIEEQCANYIAHMSYDVSSIFKITNAKAKNYVSHKYSKNYDNLYLIDLDVVDEIKTVIDERVGGLKEKVEKEDKSNIPKKKYRPRDKNKQKKKKFVNCVYKFYNKNDDIIYIGKAKKFYQRMYSHKYAGHLPIDCYECVDKILVTTFESEDDMDLVERILISKLKPMFNTEFYEKDLKLDYLQNIELEWAEFDSKYVSPIKKRD